MPPSRSIGVLLAAGAGRRMGRPKALVEGADGEPWSARGIRMLLDGGCDEVLVVLGARSDEARSLLAGPLADPRVRATDARDWAEGLSASLAHGVRAAVEAGADVVVVTLVDLPGLRPEAVERLRAGAHRGTLAQAFYDGRPGHPVVIGADHAEALLAALAACSGSGSVRADRGARAFLSANGATEVDCSDLGGGDDVDRPVRASGAPSGNRE
jgi:CTP:molybdopterin cytidylyltransferase MocA